MPFENPNAQLETPPSLTHAQVQQLIAENITFRSELKSSFKQYRANAFWDDAFVIDFLEKGKKKLEDSKTYILKILRDPGSLQDESIPLLNKEVAYLNSKIQDFEDSLAERTIAIKGPKPEIIKEIQENSITAITSFEHALVFFKTTQLIEAFLNNATRSLNKKLEMIYKILEDNCTKGIKQTASMELFKCAHLFLANQLHQNKINEEMIVLERLIFLKTNKDPERLSFLNTSMAPLIKEIERQKELKATAFLDIYRRLRNEEKKALLMGLAAKLGLTIFKSDFWCDKTTHAPAKLIEEIKIHCKENPDSRSKKAWALANEFFADYDSQNGYDPKNPKLNSDLAKEIEQLATKGSVQPDDKKAELTSSDSPRPFRYG